ncbi:3-oxoacyl-ACP reductase family protein [Rapidithrix thailandica]|uniref:3-oxoacyl-ACP reductase family protein n=1 Tax=Rapidithrix thailandica TaxID=413964 RepID=A0AAW9S1Z1_9BACT
MKQVQGKVAFITGGSRGMGAAIAKRLSQEGANIVFTHSGKNPEKANEVLEAVKANKVKGLALEADNEDPNALQRALETALQEFGRLDILVNNAGVYIQKTIEELSLSDYDQVMDVNVKAVFIASQIAARHLKSGGRIITIGSNMADRVPGAGGSLYAMSKSALIGLNKGLARDLGPKGISVNLVQPGPVDTDMNPEKSDHAPFLKDFMTFNRYGKTEEIAGLVAYLAREESQFITGTSLTIDGGFNI